MDVKKIGVTAILAASLMWSIEPILVKLAYREADFLQTSAIRAFVVTIIAWSYAMLTNKGNVRVTTKQFSLLAYIALGGTIGGDLLYYYALSKIAVINAVLIGHMQPIFIVLFGFFILKEDKLSKYDYMGILIMMVSCLLVTTKTGGNLADINLGTKGDLLVLLATVVWATAAIVMRKYLKELNAGVVTFYRYIIASLVFAIYLLITSSIQLSNTYQVLVGVVVGVGTICYYEGLKRIKAAQVSALELATPFFAALLGLLILKEQVTIMQWTGIILLLVGIGLLSKKEEA